MEDFGSDLDLSRDGDIMEVQRSVNAIIELTDLGRLGEVDIDRALLADIARQAQNINFLLFNEPVESHIGLLT